MTEEVLLLDGSGASFPIRVALENLGYEVSTIGANPSQFQARTSETHHLIDYSDHEQLTTIVREIGYAFAIPGCTDVSFKSYNSLDGLYRRLKSDTIRDLTRFLVKSELAVSLRCMRLLSLDLTTDEIIGGIGEESIIVKPADAYSGRGVTVLQRSQWTLVELEAALTRARSVSTDHCALIQRYLEGDLFSMSLFSDDLRMLVSPVVQEFVNSGHRVISSHLAAEEISQFESVKQLVDAIQQFLGKERWFLHLQFLLDPATSDVYIIDCAARCPGDYYGVLVEMASKFPYFSNYVNVFSGQSLAEFPSLKIDRCIVRKTFHGFDAMYGSGVDISGLKMLEFYPDLDWSGDVDGRIGVGFYRR